MFLGSDDITADVHLVHAAEGDDVNVPEVLVHYLGMSHIIIIIN